MQPSLPSGTSPALSFDEGCAVEAIGGAGHRPATRLGNGLAAVAEPRAFVDGGVFGQVLPTRGGLDAGDAGVALLLAVPLGELDRCIAALHGLSHSATLARRTVQTLRALPLTSPRSRRSPTVAGPPGFDQFGGG